MYFGEKLRRLRQERNWTQPDLAEKLGIEQSWLSKIENDKSVPSSELLEKIAEVFDVELAALIHELDPDYVRGTLSSLPEVRGLMQQQKYKLVHNARTWILYGTMSFATGIAMLVAGYAEFFFSDTVYLYESEGVVYPSEPENLFFESDSIVADIANSSDAVLAEGNRDRRNFLIEGMTSEKVIELELRKSVKEIISQHYRGNFIQTEEAVEEATTDIFGQPVAAGTVGLRTYYEVSRRELQDFFNSVLITIGVFLIFAGFLALIGERRLSRLSKL